MENVLKVFVLFILIAVIVTLGAVLVLVWTMPDLPTSVSNDKICLPNEYGVLGCGKTVDLLRSFLERVIEKEYEQIKTEDEERQQEFLDKNKVRLMAIYDKHYWEMKPSAKLTGKELPEPRKSDNAADMIPIRVWRHGKELHDTSGFLRYGVRYRNGRLVVPVAGTYFLYSFVDLHEKCDPSTDNPIVKHFDKSIKHGIYKFNILDEEETEVVSNVQPHTVSNNRIYDSYSSYVSTLADLKAGDELSIKVSNITYLKYPRHNYFGLNLI